MAPIVITAEYRILAELAENRKPYEILNRVALDRAKSDGYIITVGEWAIITKAGLNRLDELQD